MLPHKQVRVKVGDWEAEVDEELAPLIEELWKAKIQTSMSCQESRLGFAWIEFDSMEDLCAFMNIVGDYGPPDEDSLYSRMNWRSDDTETWWEYDLHFIDCGWHDVENGANEWHEGVPDFAFWPSVRFPRSDLPILLKRMSQWNADQEWLKELEAL
jgi:hypothetical protein